MSVSNKKRVNVTVSEELYNWCQVKSEEYGLSIPNLFVIALAQYRDQTIAMSEMPALLKRMDEFQHMAQLQSIAPQEERSEAERTEG